MTVMIPTEQREQEQEQEHKQEQGPEQEQEQKQEQADAEQPAGHLAIEHTADHTPDHPTQPTAEPDKPTDDRNRAAKPKRKTAPRKPAGTKALVVLRDGRVQFADPESVLVIDLDEAAAPETDAHDVVDRLAELRDAVDSPGKADAVRALTDLIQEKALG